MKFPKKYDDGGNAPNKLLAVKSNAPSVTKKLNNTKLPLALEAEMLTAIREGNKLISTPAFSPALHAADPAKLKAAKDKVQGTMKCNIDALLDKKCYKDFKEAFKFLSSISYFDPLMVVRLDRMLHDVETELPHYKEAIEECVTCREQAKDVQCSVKSLYDKVDAACAAKPRITELENELHDLRSRIEALEARFAYSQSLKEALQAKLDSELDMLRPEKEALEGKCRLFSDFKARLPEMKNRIKAGTGVWEAFKAALDIQLRGVKFDN